MPLERATAEAVNAGALRAGSGIGAAPEVVVDGVVSSDLRIPLTAEVGTLLDSGGGHRKGEGCRAGSNERRELHGKKKGSVCSKGKVVIVEEKCRFESTSLRRLLEPLSRTSYKHARAKEMKGGEAYTPGAPVMVVHHGCFEQMYVSRELFQDG